MKISEFIGLSFFEANKAIKKALKSNRISGGSFDHAAFKNALGLSDAVWGEITQSGDANSKIEIREKWTVTKLRVILSFRYNKDIQINYYIGNTNDSCTLKEITYSGIGTYWTGSYPALGSIGLGQDIIYEIPEVHYGNGRKGTVQDFLNKKWGLTKVNTDLTLVEVDKMLTDGSFLEAWSKAEDYQMPERQVSKTKMAGRFGKYLVKILTDGAKVSIDQIALLMKIGCGMFREYPGARLIESSFFDDSRWTKKKGLLDLKPDLEKLEKEIKRHLDLDTRMSELNNMILAEYDKTLSSYIQMNPDLNLTIEEVKKIIDLQTDVDVNYRYLKVS
jgi:hypothetical protein